MKPALTPEEWAKWTACGGFRSLERTLDDPNELYVRDTKNGVLVLPDAHFEYGLRGRARHALAALALHGQSFGFSREDIAEIYKWAKLDGDHPFGKLDNLASRIEALLPPEAE